MRSQPAILEWLEDKYPHFRSHVTEVILTFCTAGLRKLMKERAYLKRIRSHLTPKSKLHVLRCCGCCTLCEKMFMSLSGKPTTSAIRYYDELICTNDQQIKAAERSLEHKRPLSTAFVLFDKDVRRLVYKEKCSLIREEKFVVTLAPPADGSGMKDTYFLLFNFQNITNPNWSLNQHLRLSLS